jgi:hypothetical protein
VLSLRNILEYNNNIYVQLNTALFFIPIVFYYISGNKFRSLMEWKTLCSTEYKCILLLYFSSITQGVALCKKKNRFDRREEDEGGGECNKLGEASTYTIIDIKHKEGDRSVISVWQGLVVLILILKT